MSGSEGEEEDGAAEGKPPLVVVMGVCGSGKSRIGAALARRCGLPFLEGDDLHPPENRRRLAAGVALDDAARAPWLAAIAARICEAERAGAGLIVACSALKRRYRERLRAASRRLRFLHLAGPRALIAARLAARSGHFMAPSLIESQFADLEPPQADESAFTLDIAETPERLVEVACRRLGLVQSAIR